MRERRDVAHARGTEHRHVDIRDAIGQPLGNLLGKLRPHVGTPGGQLIEQENRGRAHHVGRQRRALAGRVLTNQARIEDPHLLGRHRTVLADADPRGESVHVVATLRDALREEAIDAHALERVDVQANRAGRTRRLDEVRQREVVASQSEHGRTVRETVHMMRSSARMRRPPLPSTPCSRR